jgi:hypothetical protein
MVMPSLLGEWAVVYRDAPRIRAARTVDKPTCPGAGDRSAAPLVHPHEDDALRTETALHEDLDAARAEHLAVALVHQHEPRGGPERIQEV